jgi:hypothetical protein
MRLNKAGALIGRPRHDARSGEVVELHDPATVVRRSDGSPIEDLERASRRLVLSKEETDSLWRQAEVFPGG